jgi:hypothetical protein
MEPIISLDIRTMKKRMSCLFLLLAAATGCASSPPFTPDTSLLVPWTERAQQRFPEPPYAARYERDGKSLSYVAARHEHHYGSRTFQLIDREFRDFLPQVVVIEGLETEHGTSPAFYREAFSRYLEKESWPIGEPGYSASLAQARGIPFIGGEPSDEEIRDAVVTGPIESRDLLYYYVVRQIPQWKRTGEDQTRSFEELYAESVRHDMRKLGLDDDTLADPATFAAWYEVKNGRPFRYEEVTTRQSAPVEGELFTNDMSLRIGAVREVHIVRLIAELLNKHDRVLVVYGAGHHVQQEKVLEKMLGVPRK